MSYFCIMKLVTQKSSLAFDLFYSLVFMPAIVILGPVKYWLLNWPLFSAVVILYFYAVYVAIRCCNIPKLIVGKHYKRIGILIILLISSNYLLSKFPLPKVEFITKVMSEYQTEVRNYGISLALWLIFSLVSGYALTVSFVKELYEQLLVKRNIENQRDKAKLSTLRAQISPHFMFNTLNTLYSLVIGTSQKAEDAFIKFTDLLKYTYVTMENETVAIYDEITYIQNYIDLQILRLNEHTKIRWEHDTDNENAMIPPMIMLTFVENAFKYGTSTSRDCIIAISLSLKKGILNFNVENMIMKHKDDFRIYVPTGMENTRSRLSALYPGRHSLETSETDGVFHVSLKIYLYNENMSQNEQNDNLHCH